MLLYYKCRHGNVGLIHKKLNFMKEIPHLPKIPLSVEQTVWLQEVLEAFEIRW